MPRVTDAHRRARRDEIARAAVRCMRRHGFSGTTMADIIAESGLSAGAIYANFENKAALVRHVASHVITGRAASVERLMAASDSPPSPGQVITHVLIELVRDDTPFELIVQFWGESAVDPEMKTMVRSVMTDLERVFADAITPWLADHVPAQDLSTRTRALTPVMLAVCQGFMVRASLSGDLEPAAYVAAVQALVAEH
ncbi:MAG: hypothetical protein JWP31_1095 [Aeromicrobium sp.]|nr:hypothetical protein [Aeromicrobium sp.]